MLHFFKNKGLHTNLSSLRPGKKKGNPTVNDLVEVKYLPSKAIEY